MRKLAIALTCAALLSTLGFAAPASASTGGEPAEPKASSWIVTPTKFGPHKLAESVKAASKASGISYRATLRAALGSGAKVRCPKAVRLPLLKSGVNKRNVWAYATLPCDTVKRSLAAYEARYHPYTAAVLDTFMTSGDEWSGDYVPHYAYGKYLPHARHAAVGDSYTKVAAAYDGAGGVLDQGYQENGFTNGIYILSGKLGKRITNVRMYVQLDSVSSIVLTRFPAGY